MSEMYWSQLTFLESRRHKLRFLFCQKWISNEKLKLQLDTSENKVVISSATSKFMDLLKSRLRTAALCRTLRIDSLFFTQPHFPALYGTRTVHYRTNKITLLASALSHKNADFTLTKRRVLKIHFNIIFRPTLRSPTWSSQQFCQLKYYMSSTLIPCHIRATCSISPPLFDREMIFAKRTNSKFPVQKYRSSLHQNTGKWQK